MFNVPRPWRIDRTLLHHTVRVFDVETGYMASHATVVAVHDDAFEQTYSWPRGVYRYGVVFTVDDVPYHRPWVDARYMWTVDAAADTGDTDEATCDDDDDETEEEEEETGFG